MSDTYQVIGLMSGTSLDGVDIAYCRFSIENKEWSFTIEKAESIPYDREWKQRLIGVMEGNAVDYVKTHAELGRHFGELLKDFISKNNCRPLLIASHGHTIFHQPLMGYTAQIGDGSQIAAITGIDTICDFRSKDVALNGQGAPLVPAGEVKLFKEFPFCLNLGGIANITVSKNHRLVAFDICPANMALNFLSNKKGADYDKDGLMAQKGKVIQPLLEKLNQLNYYQLPYPKSLGKEWFDTNMKPLLNEPGIIVEDVMATVCRHVAVQIKSAIKEFLPGSKDRLLITGGGAFHPLLIKFIQEETAMEIVIPEKMVIEFKEAMVFAFLGLLFYRDEKNVLKAVTGATIDHISGALYKGG